MPPNDPGTPRWRSLLAMALVVLGVHLLLLAGGLPNWHPDATAALAEPAVQAVAVQTRSIQAHEESTDSPLPATRSSVRWIALPPAGHTTTQAAAPRNTARVNPKAPPAPALVVAPVPAEATPLVEPGPPEAVSTPVEAPAPSLADTSNPAASASGAPPASDAVLVAVADTAATAEPLPATQEDTLAAAAPAASKPRAAAGPSLPPARAPGSTNLRYDVSGKAKGLPYRADARLNWQASGNSYAVELEISAFLMGSRVRTSTGRMGPKGLEPERFGDRRRSTEKATHFDRAGQRIRYSSNAPDTPLLPGAQDQLSVFLQLAALLQARPEAYAAGQSIRLQVASTGDAEVWPFQIGPEEMLTLPAGNVSARRLTRPPRREYDNTVEVWLAPGLQHLPVRIRLTDHNGDVADQLLRQMPVLGPMPNMPH